MTNNHEIISSYPRTSDGYRKNVGLVLLNQQQDVFIAKRFKKNSWQFPQGGMNPNETPKDALLREMYEEIGLQQEDISVIYQSNYWYSYSIPEGYNTKLNYKGQSQKWFLCQINDNQQKFIFDATSEQEFDDFAWVSFWDPLHQVVDFKKDVYRNVLAEFQAYLTSDIHTQDQSLNKVSS